MKEVGGAAPRREVVRGPEEKKKVEGFFVNPRGVVLPARKGKEAAKLIEDSLLSAIR